MLIEAPVVVSVTTRSVQAITMGGEQFGLMSEATIVKDPAAVPLLTLKVPDADSDALLAALGWCPPPLMHSAVPLSEMFTELRLWSSPDSRNCTVIEFDVTDVTLVAFLTKWGLSASAVPVTSPITPRKAAAVMRNRRILGFSLWSQVSELPNWVRESPTSAACRKGPQRAIFWCHDSDPPTLTPLLRNPTHARSGSPSGVRQCLGEASSCWRDAGVVVNVRTRNNAAAGGVAVLAHDLLPHIRSSPMARRSVAPDPSRLGPRGDPSDRRRRRGDGQASVRRRLLPLARG